MLSESQIPKEVVSNIDSSNKQIPRDDDPSNSCEYLSFKKGTPPASQENPKRFFSNSSSTSSSSSSDQSTRIVDSGYGDDILESRESIEKYGYMDPMTGAATSIVYSMLNIHDAEHGILECGCGTEYILPQLVWMKKKQCKLFLTDISNVKLSVIRMKCERLSGQPFNGLLYKHSEIPKDEELDLIAANRIGSSGVYFNEVLNVYVERADATILPYKNEKFDVYFGGLLVQEVKDPFAAIQEAYRVLRKGGRAGFTLFDTEKFNTDFDNIMIRAMEKVTGEQTHINYTDRQDMLTVVQLRTYLERVGFTNVVIWSQFVPYNFFTKEDYQKYLFSSKDGQEISEQDQAIYKEALNLFEQSLLSGNGPFGMNILCLVAQKLN